MNLYMDCPITFNKCMYERSILTFFPLSNFQFRKLANWDVEKLCNHLLISPSPWLNKLFSILPSPILAPFIFYYIIHNYLFYKNIQNKVFLMILMFKSKRWRQADIFVNWILYMSLVSCYGERILWESTGRISNVLEYYIDLLLFNK